VTDTNDSIIEEFRANHGRVGGQFEGSWLILIHHIGLKTRREHVTPVGCFPQSDGRFAIIASNGGAPSSPAWYYNLKAHPEIIVEFGTETFVVSVREIEDRERDRVWADALITAPQLDEYREIVTRTIPVLLLTRMAAAHAT
jgi:deazaflavin-dependent oxidoreductase (nitroreductase family)